MWPTLQQPWYFYRSAGIAIDYAGYIYIVNEGNNCIEKFNISGQFIARWGSSGNGNGEFNGPYGIVVDQNGYVYVSDRYNHRIQKFTSESFGLPME